MAKVNHDEVDGPHRTEDHTGRHGEDQFLRRHGFTIVERPKDGPPVWERKGVTYLHGAALRAATIEDKTKRG